MEFPDIILDSPDLAALDEACLLQDSPYAINEGWRRRAEAMRDKWELKNNLVAAEEKGRSFTPTQIFLSVF
jgi:hypothetical protein